MHDHTPAPEKPRAAYQLFMLALCIYALIALAAERFIPLPPDLQGLIQDVDHGVCLIFFVDFVVSLVTAPSRWRYFVTWGWIDLLSSIPTVEAFRIGRAARVMRIFRVLRGVRATKLIATFVLERRAEGAFLAPTARQQEGEMAALRREVAAIRATLERLAEGRSPTPPASAP